MDVPDVAFESALRTAFMADLTATPVQIEEANQLVNSIASNAGNWKFCAEQFLSRSVPPTGDSLHSEEAATKDLEIRFWCLQALTRFQKDLPAEERGLLRHHLLASYFSNVFFQRVETFMLHGRTKRPDETAVFNKICLLFVQGVALDYPHNWPDAFTSILELFDSKRAEFEDVRSAIDSGGSCDVQRLRRSFGNFLAATDLLLTILELFDTEILSDEISRSAEERRRGNELKDALRLGDILCIVEAWYYIIADLGLKLEGQFNERSKGVELLSEARPFIVKLASDPDMKDQYEEVLLLDRAVQLLGQCFAVLGRYIGWIDVHVLANERFLLPAYTFMRWEYGADVFAFIRGLLSKRMDGAQRIVICQRLGVVDALIGAADRAVKTVKEFEVTEVSTTDGSSLPNGDGGSEKNVTRPVKFLEELGQTFATVGQHILAAFRDLRKFDGSSAASVTCEAGDSDVRESGGIEKAGPNPYFTPVVSASVADSLQRQGWQQLEALVDRSTVIFSHSNPAVAEAVEPFLSEFIKFVSQANSAAEEKERSKDRNDGFVPLPVPISDLRAFIFALLELSVSKVAYPSWYDWRVQASSDDEQHQRIVSFREQMTKFFKRVFALDPSVTSVRFLRTLSENLNAAATDTRSPAAKAQLEACLHLVYAIGEFYLRSVDSQPMIECLDSVFRNEALMTNGDPEVKLHLCNLIRRFYDSVHGGTLAKAYVVNVLNFFLGERGTLRPTEDPHVLSSACGAFGRFCKSNTTNLASFSEKILQALEETGLLTIRPEPSAVQQLSRRSSDSSKSFESLPSGPAGLPWSFDDQNRCFEAIGCLLSRAPVGAEVLQRLNDSLFKTAEEAIVRADSGSTECDLWQLCSNDPSSALDYVCRVMQAAGHFTKGFTAANAEPQFCSRCLNLLLGMVRLLGTSARVREASLLLVRRLLALLRERMKPHLLEVLPALYDLTIRAAARDPNFAFCGSVATDITRAEQSVFYSRIGWSYTSYQCEMTQLAVVVAHSVISLRSVEANEFLLHPVPVPQVAANSASPVAPSGSTTTFFRRLFNQHLQYCQAMPATWPEQLREQKESLTDVFQMLNSVCVNNPVAAMELILNAHGSADAANQGPGVVEFLLWGLQKNPAEAANIVAYSIGSFQALLQRFLSKSSPDYETVLQRLSVPQLLQHLCTIVTQLDIALDGQHNKMLHEIVELCRMLCKATSGEGADGKEGVVASLRNHAISLFEQAFSSAPTPTLGRTPADIFSDVLTARSTKEAHIALRRWILAVEKLSKPQ